MEKLLKISVPFLIFSLFLRLSTLNTQAADVGAVVINEICTDPQNDWSSNDFDGTIGNGNISSGVDEWLEIYIKKDGLNLTEYKIQLLDTTPIEGTVSAGGAFQVSNYIGSGSFENTKAGDYLILGNVAGSGAMNNKIQIILTDSLDVTIDKVSLGDWGDGDNAPDGNATGDIDEVVARDHKSTDTDQDNSDFYKTSATMGETNPPPPSYSTEIKINEITPNPEGSDDNEFLELYNEGSEDVDLKGWKIADKTSTKVIGDTIELDSTVILNLSFLVIYKKDGSVSLNNTGDTIQLLHPNDNIVDEITYSSIPEGYAYAKRSNGTWEETTLPTPGTENQFPDPSEADNDSTETGDLQDIKKLPLGTSIFVQAWVTAEPGILGKKVMYIQDKTDGIKVSLNSDNYSKFKLGDYIELSCSIEQSRSEYYIKMGTDSSLLLLTTNQLKPTPIRIKTGQVGEEFEGRLVILNGDVVESSGNTFWINDGSGKAKIYIKDATEIEKPSTPKGTQVEAVGIVSQYGDYKDGTPNFRVLPRYLEDLIIIEKGNNPSGSVLGVSSLKELPKTGVDEELLFGILSLLLGVALRIYLFKTRYLNYSQWKTPPRQKERK